MARLLGFFRNSDLDCVGVRKLSSSYLEGDLPPSRLEKVRAHLSGCPPCQSFVDGLASMVNMLSELTKVRPPSTLKQTIVERIKEEEGKRTKG